MGNRAGRKQVGAAERITALQRAVFNTMNRLANAFGWTWSSDDHARAAVTAIHRFSYRLPGVQ